MQRTTLKLSLKLILSLAIVQVLVSWIPNRAQAAEFNLNDRVNDAKYVLALAAINNPDYAPYFKQVLKSLSTIKIMTLPMGTDFAHCKSYPIFAYYDPYKTEIHLCELSLKQTNDRIVQTLIHEASHAAGIKDECSATRLSIYAMMAARRVSYQVGYDCQI